MGENSRELTESKCRNCARAIEFKIFNDNMWKVFCVRFDDWVWPKLACDEQVEE